jgi:hypothetical protein
MSKSFALSFQLKRPKQRSTGSAPIYLKVTIDSERVEISTKRVRYSINNDGYNNANTPATFGQNPYYHYLKIPYFRCWLT